MKLISFHGRKYISRPLLETRQTKTCLLDIRCKVIKDLMDVRYEDIRHIDLKVVNVTKDIRHKIFEDGKVEEERAWQVFIGI